jgi:hypothetical protein
MPNPEVWNKINKEDAILVAKIVDRAMNMTKDLRAPNINKLSFEMDITLAHITSPIRLKELLAAPNGDFGHDVFGIAFHINRDTGELKDGFSPRYSAH